MLAHGKEARISCESPTWVQGPVLARNKHEAACELRQPGDATVQQLKLDVISSNSTSVNRRSLAPLVTAAPIRRGPTHTSSIWDPLVSPSLWAIPMLRTPGYVRTSQTVGKAANHMAEALTKVSLKLEAPRSGETPPACVLECFEKRSAVAARPVIKQALMPFLSKAGEKRQTLEAVVNRIKGPNGKMCPPIDKTVFTLPVSALPVHATSPHLGKSPLVAHHSESSSERSTAVMGPAVKPAPTSYSSFKVRERLRGYDAAVNIWNEMNENGHSPEPSAVSKLHASALTPRPIRALFLFRPKPLDDGSPLRCLDATANLIFSSRVERRSTTLLKMGSPPVSKPGIVWAGDTSRFSSLELVRWECMKLPDTTTCRQFLCKAVSSLSKRKGLDTHIRWSAASWNTMMPTSARSFLVYTTHTPSALMPNDGTATPPQVISIRNNAHRVRNSDIEFHSRDSSEATSLWLSEIPSTNGIERLDEHSVANMGPAVRQALAPSSAEVEEKRQASDDIVSINNGGKENRCSHHPLAAFTLPAPAPSAQAVSLAHAVLHRQLSAGLLTQTEMASGWDEIHIASRRLSIALVMLAYDEGEEHLMRAAAHIHEKVAQRSPTFDEFACRVLKVTPDKAMEPDNLQCILNVVSENEKVSAKSRSPESSMGKTSLFRPQSEAVLLLPDGEVVAALSQPEVPRCETSDDGVWEHNVTLSIEAIASKMKGMNEVHALSQSSLELDRLLVKSPNNGDCERQPIKVVSSSDILEAEKHSPKDKTVTSPPVSRPSVAWISLFRCLSVELRWRAYCKLLNAVASNQRYLLDVVNTLVIWSAMWHPLRTRTGCVPILEPDLTLTDLCRLMKGLAGLELDVSTVVTKSLSTLKETNQMEHEMCSRSHLRSKS